jgi:hypothetical protein
MARGKTDPAGAQTEAFPASDYDNPALRLPYVDGHKIDKISVRFAGSVDLDRTNPDHVELIRALNIGADVAFEKMPPLAGYVSSKPPRSVRSGDGYRADVAQTTVITITDIGGFGAAAAAKPGPRAVPDPEPDDGDGAD